LSPIKDDEYLVGLTKEVCRHHTSILTHILCMHTYIPTLIQHTHTHSLSCTFLFLIIYQEIRENLEAYKKLAEELKMSKVKTYAEMSAWLRKTYQFSEVILVHRDQLHVSGKLI
jgi:hypothetical protein